MKINVISENERMERLTNALAADNGTQARKELLSIRKSLNNEKYKLEQKIKSDKFSGAALQSAKVKVEELEKDIDTVKQAAAVVRKAMNNPKVRTTSALNRINLVLNQRAAEREEISEINEQRKEQGKKQITVFEVRATEKMQILAERLIYKNPLYYLGENVVESIQEVFAQIPEFENINIEQDIVNIFDKDKHFESGDEYEELKELFADYQYTLERNRDILDAEQVTQIETALNRLYEGLGG